jgi:hypothetical protein
VGVELELVADVGDGAVVGGALVGVVPVGELVGDVLGLGLWRAGELRHGAVGVRHPASRLVGDPRQGRSPPVAWANDAVAAIVTITRGITTAGRSTRRRVRGGELGSRCRGWRRMTKPPGSSDGQVADEELGRDRAGIAVHRAFRSGVIRCLSQE